MAMYGWMGPKLKAARGGLRWKKKRRRARPERAEEEEEVVAGCCWEAGKLAARAPPEAERRKWCLDGEETRDR